MQWMATHAMWSITDQRAAASIYFTEGVSVGWGLPNENTCCRANLTWFNVNSDYYFSFDPFDPIGMRMYADLPNSQRHAPAGGSGFIFP